MVVMEKVLDVMRCVNRVNTDMDRIRCMSRVQSIAHHKCLEPSPKVHDVVSMWAWIVCSQLYVNRTRSTSKTSKTPANEIYFLENDNERYLLIDEPYTEGSTTFSWETMQSAATGFAITFNSIDCCS